jgi:hypothetical protein
MLHAAVRRAVPGWITNCRRCEVLSGVLTRPNRCPDPRLHHGPLAKKIDESCYPIRIRAVNRGVDGQPSTGGQLLERLIGMFDHE